MTRSDYETETLIVGPRGEGVRHMTPAECERAQGFPVGHTAVEFKGKPAPDYYRWKAIGNSMAVPVMRWIGERIEAADKRLDATSVSGRE